MVDASKTYLFSACICCHNGCWTEFDKIVAGDIAEGKCHCLCIEEQLCINPAKINAPLICGVPDGKICQLGCGCCACALQQPDLKQFVKGAGHCLCCAQSAAFPFDGENPLMCALCCISLFPKQGVAMTWADACK